ncbi:MAG: DoxX family protein [Alphaproteobacteria bacterium]|nr:DoxX family protein [Alphaproteobacteria bacterium]
MSNGAQTTLIIPALGGIYDGLGRFTDPLVRVITGLLLIPHGMQKLFGSFGGNIEGTIGFMSKMGIEPAAFFAYYIGVLEFFGGIMLVLGLLTRVVAAQVLGFMLVAAFVVHLPVGGFFWTNRGYEYPLMWAVLALVVLIRGGGEMSLDKRIGKEF